MKKLLIFFIFITLHLHAQQNYELKLYEKVLPALFHRHTLKVFVDKDVKSLLESSDKFIVVNRCDESTILLIGKEFPLLDDKCKNKPLFSTTYLGYKEQKNSFGAFYWRKGRPQLRFKKAILKKFNIALPSSFKKYLDD